MNKKYTHSIYIGKFQAFHNAHLLIIKNALKISDKLIIIIGSHDKPIDWKNPFTSKERIEMIKQSLSAEELNNIYFQTVQDRLYQNAEWQSLIYDAVDSILMQYSKYRLNSTIAEKEPSIALVGCDKDTTSWYLKSFPQWKQELIDTHITEDTVDPLSSTLIRNLIYNNNFGYAKNLIPDGSYNYIKNWMNSDSFFYVKSWYDEDVKYQKVYENLPYGTNFYCADSVVFQSGHVLLIKRKSFPGKGLWACPGGFIELGENAFDASIRELTEETDINIPKKVLIGSFVGEKLFDHPERSLRGRVGDTKVGRTISISHCYSLQNGEKLSKVKGGDDAEIARWFNLAEVKNMRSLLLEDHSDQINYWMARIDDKRFK